ncbi:pumilio homolog 24 [Physcomitrium patens]|uniref:PUM-HD domain-containing protein n=1 Tax=Physcomitrium patens TaxID=3218 RepID=A0A2K1KJ62_PHYPA|nr:pumilio homolog 24-like [Physcomitrium patens]PNR53822.1 hypothetical protein PHYPA_007497 [Physcomitrium patens]|eukprot:XP_024374908.1 pumilio homolog 24-like [Physcomitrella patens]
MAKEIVKKGMKSAPPGKSKPVDSKDSAVKKEPFRKMSEQEARKAKQELTETRKRKRKPHYEIEKEVISLWEKTRVRDVEKDERSKLVSQVLLKMKGKMPEMALNHIVSRALQNCVKYCTPTERAAVFEELRPHCLALMKDKYAHHIVIKMLDSADKAQLQQMLSLLHGNVVALLRHPHASPVVEHAYTLANAAQKLELLSEFYSPEFRLFKGLNAPGKGRLAEFFAAEPAAKKRSVLEHMTLALQPILEKGIVDHSIIHRAIVEYLSVSKKSMIAETVQQLSGGLLVRMVHTRDGAKIGVTCVMHGNNKERKKIIKGMKGHVAKIARDDHGYMVLIAILDVVDDTKLVTKIIIKELMKELKELASHKFGRLVLLHLLAPRVRRYFPADVLALLEHPAPTSVEDEDVVEENAVIADASTVSNGSVKGGSKKSAAKKARGEGGPEPMDEDEDEEDGDGASAVSKKDPGVRRSELLSKSGLAKDLAEICRVNAKEMLLSQWGTEIIYEVAMGGVNGELWKTMPGAIMSLHKEIADLATIENQDEEDAHVMEQYFSSPTLRRLILNSTPPPEGVDGQSFATVFWSVALKKKCKRWAQGHSQKVVSAYRECSDLAAREAAKAEIQGLVAAGLLKPVAPSQQNGKKR